MPRGRTREHTLRSKGSTRGVRDGDWKASRCGGRDHGDGRAGGVVGNEPRSAIPPKGLTVPGVARRAGARAGSGGADVRQRHVAARLLGGTADWVNRRALGRVELRQRRRRQARPRCTSTSRARRRPTRRPEGPGHLRGQPVLRRQRRRRRTGPSTTSSARRRPRGIHAPFFNGTQHEPEHQQRSTRPPGCRAASRVVHSESPGTGYSDGCPTSGGANETLGATAVIDWLNGRAQGLHDPRRHDRGRRRHLAQRQDRR